MDEITSYFQVLYLMVKMPQCASVFMKNVSGEKWFQQLGMGLAEICYCIKSKFQQQYEPKLLGEL